MMGAAMLKCHRFVQSLWALYRLVVSSITFVRHLYVGESGEALVMNSKTHPSLPIDLNVLFWSIGNIVRRSLASYEHILFCGPLLFKLTIRVALLHEPYKTFIVPYNPEISPKKCVLCYKSRVCYTH